jgi:hypothetical protein
MLKLSVSARFLGIPDFIVSRAFVCVLPSAPYWKLSAVQIHVLSPKVKPQPLTQPPINIISMLPMRSESRCQLDNSSVHIGIGAMKRR